MCAKSHEFSSGEQDRAVSGSGGLHCLLDEKSGAHDGKAGGIVTISILFSVYADWLWERYRTGSAPQKRKDDPRISKAVGENRKAQSDLAV